MNAYAVTYWYPYCPQTYPVEHVMAYTAQDAAFQVELKKKGEHREGFRIVSVEPFPQGVINDRN